MPARFVNVDHDTPLLLPPDLRQWVPAGHLVHFIMDAVAELDLGLARVNERGTGDAQYPPRLLLGLLIYSYATGVFSSRQIERTTYESVAVRLLCADTHPDHDTLCTFRRQNGPLLTQAFAQILELAARCGVLKVGGITVAIDGTKILANASKHSAVSHGHAEKTLRTLDLEIAELLAKADQADATPLQDGLSIPAEVQRRQERQAQLQRAKTEMEARAYARCAAAEMHSGFSTLRSMCGMNCGVRIELIEETPALIADLERMTKLWEEGISRFGGPFLAGRRFTAADAFFCPVAFRAQTYNILTEGVAGHYVQTLLDLTAMREWYNAALAETFRDPPHEADIEKYGKLTADFRLTA